MIIEQLAVVLTLFPSHKRLDDTMESGCGALLMEEASKVPPLKPFDEDLRHGC